MTSSSKGFPGQPDGEIRQWQPPELNGNGPSRVLVRPAEPPSQPPTAAQLEAIQQEAYAEGHEKGRQEGYEFGRKEGLKQTKQELQTYTASLDRLLDGFAEPLRELDNQVEQELLSLVIAIVRQLLRREVKSDPNLIIGVVREALSILPVVSRNVSLLVHPEDAVLIREVYDLSGSEMGWSLREDPVVSRGGCRVITDKSQIDATLDSRLTSLIAPLLAGARSIDEAQE